MLFATDCVRYYGGENFGAEGVGYRGMKPEEYLYTAEGVEEYMSSYNIPSNIYFDGE
jgi:hypothetical protein